MKNILKIKRYNTASKYVVTIIDFQLCRIDYYDFNLQSFYPVEFIHAFAGDKKAKSSLIHRKTSTERDEKT
jgi:hypothetical protein